MSSLSDRWASLRTAHEALMVDDAQQLLRLDREVIRKHHGLPATTEDEVIHVGDIYQTTSQSPKVATVAKGVGTLGKLAIAAGLLGSGAGIGAAIPLALEFLKPDPVAVVDTDTDTDTQFELRLLPTEDEP